MRHDWLKTANEAAPLVSAIVSIVAVVVSTTTAVAAAMVARRRSKREARAVAYAISPAVVAISAQCRLAVSELDNLRLTRGHEVGQTVAAAVASVAIDIPPMLDRHLDRVGALPDAVGRDCLDLVTSVLALQAETALTANRVGTSDRSSWGPVVEHRVKLIDGILARADRTAIGLGKVASRRIR